MMSLLLLHIPALVAYVVSEHASQDAFPRRQNACFVVEEFTKLARGDSTDLECLRKAVEKCKGPAKDISSLTAKTLASLHDAWSKLTPPIARPVADPDDTCDADAWNAERSYVRELFGTQLATKDGSIKHPLVLELASSSGNSLAKCIREYLGNATIRRAPLVLVIAFKPSKKFVDYPFDFTFAGIKYTLCGVATPEKAMYEVENKWNIPVKSIITRDACVIAYKRTAT